VRLWLRSLPIEQTKASLFTELIILMAVAGLIFERQLLKVSR
jgi:hypothetical protein